MIVILHNIRSSHNVGSIFRTADAAGIEKIYCCGITPAPLDRFGQVNQKLTKVSLGAEKYINWKKTKSIVSLLGKLQKQGYRVLAIEQDKNSINLFNFQLAKSGLSKTVLVLGNEIKGLPRAILKRADKIIEIPMRGKKESLNVAVAFGIVAFQILRRQN